jgi:hypothetical protein
MVANMICENKVVETVLGSIIPKADGLMQSKPKGI